MNTLTGVPNGTRNAFRISFQIAIQGRLALGTDPARQQFNNAVGRGPGGGRMNPEALKARMTRLVPNAFLDIIAINDSAKLELTADQITRLQASGDAFKVKADSLVDKVANILGDTTVKSPDPMTIFGELQPSMAEGRKLATQGISDAKAILTPAQWAKVPESGHSPGRPPFAGPRLTGYSPQSFTPTNHERLPKKGGLSRPDHRPRRGVVLVCAHRAPGRRASTIE